MSEWISVDERLPPEEGHYLVFVKTTGYQGYCNHVDIAAHQGGEWSNDFGWLVTHWQPLPEPPQ